jgi:hypothetical protein
LLAVPASSQEWIADTDGPEPTVLTYAAEVGSGLALGIGGLIAGWNYYDRHYDQTSFFPDLRQLGVCLTPALIGVVGGTCLAGAAFKQDGRLLPTLAYAAGSMAAGAGIFGLGVMLDNSPSREDDWPVPLLIVVGAATIVASPGYATWGYNQSRLNAWASSRIVPGSVALGCDTDSNGLCHLSFDARLVSVRF